MEYDFSTLNDRDLELLARDILSIKLGLDFQSFKSGQDKGIDLRHATTNNENEAIVQVKHYLESGLVQLKSKLKKDEIVKVRLLNPQRYIFVTSLPLNVAAKEAIKKIFSPYILSTNDILGKSDLNNFLRNNPKVVENHFKLWLSSVDVIQRILRNGIKGRSEFHEQKIRKNIQLFVPSKTHNQAIATLNKYHFILITGAPGIGKSTLANILTYQLLESDFELVYVREIQEAEDKYTTTKKQVFYFDDFLGATTLDLHSSRNADSAIVQFIERIKGDKTKRLILTCRTTILNQAKAASDAISNSKMELSKYEVKIEDLRDIEKAKILYNHIYFSNLSDDLKAIFFKEYFYWEVINHPNYNPRLIEYFTDIERLQAGVEYSLEIIQVLDNPSAIWERAFNIQISESARLLIFTLFSLGNKKITEQLLKTSFDARIHYEVLHNNYTKKPNEFSSASNELIGGFLNRIVTITDKYTYIEYRFINPSIEDFLYIYFKGTQADGYFSVLKSSIRFEQFRQRIRTLGSKEGKSIYFSGNNYKKLLQIFENRIPHLQPETPNRELYIISIYLNVFHWKDISAQVIGLLNFLELTSLSWENRKTLIEILAYIGNNDLFGAFDITFEQLLLELATSMSYHFQIEEFSNLIKKHSFYHEIIQQNKLDSTEFYENFEISIHKSWTIAYDYFMKESSGVTAYTNENEIMQHLEQRVKRAEELNAHFSLSVSPVFEELKIDPKIQLRENLDRAKVEDTVLEEASNEDDIINSGAEIDRLFNSPERDYPF